MSLRSRLIAGVVGIASTLIVVAIIVTISARSNMIAQLDDRLRVTAQRSANFRDDMAAPDDDGPKSTIPAPSNQTGPDQTSAVRLSDMYEGVIQDGTLQTRFEPNLPGHEFGVPDIDVNTVADLEPGDHFAETPTETEQSTYRMLLRVQGQGRVDVAAIDMKSVNSSTRQLLIAQLIGLASAFAVLGLVAWWMIRLGIRPIIAMTDTAKRIADGDLSRRVEEGDQSTESGQLADALNVMLSRIEQSSRQRAESEDRLRRFVSDASHELRTPITTIRGYAELYSMGALADQAELDDAMRRTHEESQRMGRLVEDLLNLAKLDEQRPISAQTLNIAQLARDSAADALAIAPERDIRCVAPDEVSLCGDIDRLRQVFANIVNNALIYTPATASVVITVTPTDDNRVEVTFTDDGPGMSAEDAARITERFFRVDQARTRGSAAGSGLGMSIVDAIVRAHGGTVSVQSSLGSGTTVTLDVPKASQNRSEL